MTRTHYGVACVHGFSLLSFFNQIPSRFRWGFLPVAFFNATSLMYYLIIFLAPWTCERAVRHLLKDTRHRALVNDEDEKSRKLIRTFAECGFRRDGALLFWFIEGEYAA